MWLASNKAKRKTTKSSFRGEYLRPRFMDAHNFVTTSARFILRVGLIFFLVRTRTLSRIFLLYGSPESRWYNTCQARADFLRCAKFSIVRSILPILYPFHPTCKN